MAEYDEKKFAEALKTLAEQHVAMCKLDDEDVKGDYFADTILQLEELVDGLTES